MTTVLERPVVHSWETRPGWGISVDLTPPEILGARQARAIKRLIALGLVLVAVVCAGVMLKALDDRSAARDSYDAEQIRTAQLQAGAGTYTEVTMLSDVANQIAAEIALLMKDDVDFVQLMSLIRDSLPPHVTITNEAVQLAPLAVAAGSPTEDATGPRVIGSIVLAGNGRLISDLAPFVAALNHLRGVLDVVPTSTAHTEDGMDFTLTMNITDELYTHLYDQAGAR